VRCLLLLNGPQKREMKKLEKQEGGQVPFLPKGGSSSLLKPGAFLAVTTKSEASNPVAPRKGEERVRSRRVWVLKMRFEKTGL